MSLGLIKPGASVALRHPRTNAIVEPLYVRPDGRAVWPVMGGAPNPEDPDDPTFVGGGGQDPEDEDDEDDEPDEKPVKRRSAKPKSRRTEKDDEDGDDDEDEDDRPSRPERQAARYRTRLREAERQRDELAQRIKALENKDKPEGEVTSQELTETKAQLSQLAAENRGMRAQLAFFSVPTGINWVDPADAFALAEREGLLDDVIDDDGTVDKRELRRGLKDLAKRKPHLVVKTEDPKARGRGSDDDDEDSEEEDDNEPRSRRSAGTMNGQRRGKRQAGPTRTELAKKFPVLGRI